MKLSKTQQGLLDAMKAGVVVQYSAYWCGSSAYFYRVDTQERVTKAAQALLDKGLAERYDRTPRRDCKVRLLPDAVAAMEAKARGAA